MTALADKYHGSALNEGVTTASSVRTSKSCTASATPNTVGAWVEVDPSLSADSDGIHVMLAAATGVAVTNTSTILDIGTGASTAEVVWARVLIGYRNFAELAQNGQCLVVPGFMASGTRVAVRAQSASASKVVNAWYTFLPATKTGDFVNSAPVSMGITGATSKGITLTAPGSLNTKGAWTVIEASTTAPFNALCVSFQGDGGTAMNGSGVLIDIGIGASGQETVLIADITAGASTSEWYLPATALTYGVYVPQGSRLSARYARNNAGNAVDLALLGAT